MRLHRYAFAFVLRSFDILWSMAVSIATIALSVIQPLPSWAWRVTEQFKLAAFKVIDILAPVYRESYDTHGLSLDRRWRC